MVLFIIEVIGHNEIILRKKGFYEKMILNQYGSVDVMQIVETAIPEPAAKQIVIKTAAIGVNDPDIVIRANGPFPTMPKN